MIAFPELPTCVTHDQMRAALEALRIPSEHVVSVSMDARAGVRVYLRVQNIEASADIPIGYGEVST